MLPEPLSLHAMLQHYFSMGVRVTDVRPPDHISLAKKRPQRPCIFNIFSFTMSCYAIYHTIHHMPYYVLLSVLVGLTVHHHPLSLPLSPALLISLSPHLFLSPLSLSSHLFSPPHAGPQWIIWLEYQGSTKYLLQRNHQLMFTCIYY